MTLPNAVEIAWWDLPALAVALAWGLVHVRRRAPRSNRAAARLADRRARDDARFN